MQPLPLEEFRERALVLYSAGSHKSRHTYLKIRFVLDVLAKISVETTADLTTASAARFVKHLRCGPNTVRGYLCYLRTLCSLAIEEGWLDRQPSWKRVAPRPAKMTRNPVKSHADVARLLEELRQRSGTDEGGRLYALAYTIAITGLRRDEALCLRVEDLDFGRRQIHIIERERRLKTADSARSVPMPTELVPILIDQVRRSRCQWVFPGVRRQGPWLNATNGVRALKQLQAVAGEIGLGRVTWHGLRHSFATFALVEWRRPLWAVSKALGHRSISTTERYLHLSDPAKLADEFRDVGFRPAE